MCGGTYTLLRRDATQRTIYFHATMQRLLGSTQPPGFERGEAGQGLEYRLCPRALRVAFEAQAFQRCVLEQRLRKVLRVQAIVP